MRKPALIRAAKGRRTSSWAAGFSFLEFSLAFGMLSLVLLGLVLLVSSTDDSSPFPDISPYRWTNALYATGQLEKARSAIRAYVDQTGELPGDYPGGNSNGRIEKELGESDRVFEDLRISGVLPDKTFLVRGVQPELFYLVLRADDRLIAEGHFFKLPKFKRLEALAMDRKYDDGRSDSGSIIYSLNDDGSVDCYVAMTLF